MDMWIARMVAQRSRRRALAWLGTFLLIVIGLIAQGRYFRNVFKGPFDTTAADLNAITDVDNAPNYYVHVQGSRAIDTGLQQVTVRKKYGRETGRSVLSYYALAMGDKFLVMKASHGAATNVTGALKKMPSDVESELFRDPDIRAIRERFYNFYLDDSGFTTAAYMELVGLAIFLILFAVYGRRAWGQWFDVNATPVMKRLQSWGDALGVSVAVEREVASPRFQGGGWMMTDSYLVRSTFFGFDVLRLSDLIWGFKRVTKHSVNFIPTGKTYAAEFRCYGGNALLPNNEKTVDAALRYAAESVPWAVVGFSPDLQKLWDTKQSDFCAAVEGRRRTRPAGSAI
jgi:hypothetical protein